MLEAKLTSFLSQIKQEANEAKTLPDKGTPALESTKQEKKKFELASINSKLNSMLSSKRIALKQSTPSGLPEETI